MVFVMIIRWWIIHLEAYPQGFFYYVVSCETRHVKAFAEIEISVAPRIKPILQNKPELIGQDFSKD